MDFELAEVAIGSSYSQAIAGYPFASQILDKLCKSFHPSIMVEDSPSISDLFDEDLTDFGEPESYSNIESVSLSRTSCGDITSFEDVSVLPPSGTPQKKPRISTAGCKTRRSPIEGEWASSFRLQILERGNLNHQCEAPARVSPITFVSSGDVVSLDEAASVCPSVCSPASEIDNDVMDDESRPPNPEVGLGRLLIPRFVSDALCPPRPPLPGNRRQSLDSLKLELSSHRSGFAASSVFGVSIGVGASAGRLSPRHESDQHVPHSTSSLHVSPQRALDGPRSVEKPPQPPKYNQRHSTDPHVFTAELTARLTNLQLHQRSQPGASCEDADDEVDDREYCSLPRGFKINLPLPSLSPAAEDSQDVPCPSRVPAQSVTPPSFPVIPMTPQPRGFRSASLQSFQPTLPSSSPLVSPKFRTRPPTLPFSLTSSGTSTPRAVGAKRSFADLEQPLVCSTPPCTFRSPSPEAQSHQNTHFSPFGRSSSFSARPTYQTVKETRDMDPHVLASNHGLHGSSNLTHAMSGGPLNMQMHGAETRRSTNPEQRSLIQFAVANSLKAHSNSLQNLNPHPSGCPRDPRHVFNAQPRRHTLGDAVPLIASFHCSSGSSASSAGSAIPTPINPEEPCATLAVQSTASFGQFPSDSMSESDSGSYDSRSRLQSFP